VSRTAAPAPMATTGERAERQPSTAVRGIMGFVRWWRADSLYLGWDGDPADAVTLAKQFGEAVADSFAR
jgi:hypothetical protein